MSVFVGCAKIRFGNTNRQCRMKMINKCMRKVLSIDYKQLEFNLKCADTVVIRVINSKITKSKIKSCSNKLGRAPESAYAFGVGCYVSSPLPNRHTPLGMRALHCAPSRRYAALPACKLDLHR